MSLNIGDNFSFKGKKPLDDRIIKKDLLELKNCKENEIYDGIRVYVLSEKKFYTYNSTNEILPDLGKWRTDTIEAINIQNASIDKNENNNTYGHLLIFLSDGTTKDCGYILPKDGIKGDKGDPGEDGKGFAIVKIYESTDAMLNDTNPVSDGEMVAIISTVDGNLEAKIYIRNRNQLEDDTNLLAYTFFCNLTDATVIQGPKGKDGKDGDKGDKGDNGNDGKHATVITKPIKNGNEVTFKYWENVLNSDGTITPTEKQVQFNVYDGSNGISITDIKLNDDKNKLIITMSNNTGYNIDLPSNLDNSKNEVILGVFDSNPVSFNQGDKFYHSLDNKIYTAENSTTFDSGVEPIENTIYISKNDKALYAYVDGVFAPYGISNSGNEGKSAYEIAVEKGFKGTEEEWLKSLKGYPSINPINKHWMIGDEDTGISSTINPLDYTNNIDGLEDTPIGNIIAFLGSIPPKHYLSCDGTVYNITDYLLLAEHIRNEYGTYNFFGGDGITTFAVPDLRGEFLRGIGTAKRNTGNGENQVGLHQNPTYIPYLNQRISANNTGLIFYAGETKGINNDYNPINTDVDNKLGNKQGMQEVYSSSNNNNTYINSESVISYSVRPTNTSVNYCIKYEPTYFINMVGHEIIKDLSNYYEINTNMVKNNVVDVKLKESFKNYNTLIFVIESFAENHWLGKKNNYFEVSEIVINPLLTTNSNHWENIESSYIFINGSISIKLYGAGGGFIDETTFRITQYHSEHELMTKLRLKIVGIKKANRYTDMNGNNPNCDCNTLSDADILAAINETIDELNGKGV